MRRLVANSVIQTDVVRAVMAFLQVTEAVGSSTLYTLQNLCTLCLGQTRIADGAIDRLENRVLKCACMPSGMVPLFLRRERQRRARRPEDALRK